MLIRFGVHVASVILNIKKSDIIKSTVGTWCWIFYIPDNVEKLDDCAAKQLNHLFGPSCFAAQFSAVTFTNKEDAYRWIERNGDWIPFEIYLYNPNGDLYDAFLN